MAPRLGGRRNTSAQPEEIFELGVQGRKTGVKLHDTGARDEYGMQPLDTLFSSPEKTANVNMNGARTPSVNGAQYSENGDDDDSDELPMDIENTTAPDPARMMNGNGIKLPLPRARSPVKTYLQSPAQKNPHLGPSSSPVRGSIVEQRARDSAERGLSPKRRLDFGMNGSSRPVLKPTRTSPRTTRKDRATSRDAEADDEEAILQGQEETNGHDESMAMIDVNGDDDMPIMGDDDDLELGEDSRNDETAESTRSAPRQPTRRSGRLSESILADETADFPEPEAEPEEEDAEPSPVPQPSKKRGRPAGKAKAVEPEAEEEEEPLRRATKRRRSNNPVEEEPAEPAPKKPAGRPRGRPAGAAKQTALPIAEATAAQKPKGKRGRPAKNAAARRSESPAAGADTSLAVVPRGPPLPKSRGLLINRRVEVPGSNDGILRTRSGRNSFRPLAFWRNEHVDYDQDAAVEDPFARGKGKVLLPTVKEIVRVEQEEAPTKKKSGYHKSKSTAPSKSKGRSSTSQSNPFYDDEPADAWEEYPGRMEGDTIMWHPEYDWAPPAPDEEVDVEHEQQLAISGRSIQTREIRNASFKFTKTLSTPFLGTGVVDLPPGAEKRPKNSRKMYMAFFVFAGRVLVTVNATSFRIGRGGMWFVPRGNTYSIENDYDEPARVFFSQGCEMPAQAEAQEGAENEGVPAGGA